MSSLPAGTVTFLFTDIEGSTRLLRELGDRYREVLSEQRRLIREAIENWGGHEVDTQGDALFAAFSSARSAVGAAAECQRSLASWSWPEGTTMRVRMGLHTGEPTVTEGGYVGMDVHRGARIAAAAHGGQVLLSSRTAELTGDALPAGVDLLDLGDHRLKDLEGPTRLVQLVIDGLFGDFPRVRSLGIPTNLLSQPTSFVGREREIADVAAIVRRPDVRLLTLTGPGGVGKTRLAFRVAAGLLDEFVSGVFVVPLAQLADAGLVVPSIATALGMADRGGQPVLEAVQKELQGKQVLLVLDNFEHVLDAAQVASSLLASCPGLKTLVTSREPLRLAGEYEYPVPTLTSDQAVELFAQRAQAVQPEFSVGDANRASVEALCRRLDRLPLAVELAASRIKLFSPAAMLERLGQRFAMLSGGPADVSARQQTLRNTIAWSYNLLDHDQQATFRGLAVFGGGCTPAAADDVVSTGGLDLLDTLATLADKSLLRIAHDRDGEPRFRMLETIREYALDQLEETGEAHAVRRRLAEHFLTLVETAEPELRGSNQLLWVHRLDDEVDNLRAALEWALGTGGLDDPSRARVALRMAGALGWYWYAHGHGLEGCRWLEAALTQTDEAGAARAKAMHGLGVLMDQRGDHVRAMELFDASLAVYRELGARSEMARELNSLGVSAWAAGDPRRSRSRLEEALVLRRELGEAAGLSGVLANLAIIAMEEADAEAATAYLQESLALDRQLGDTWGIAVNLGNLGSLALDQGDLPDARARIAEALRSVVELGYQHAIADCLEKAAGLAAAMKRPKDAVRLAGAADTLREAIGVPLDVPDQAVLDKHLDVARAELSQGDFDGAWADGKQLDLDAAVELAMHVAEDGGARPSRGP